MRAEELDAIRARHRHPRPADECQWDGETWPCDAARLLEALADAQHADRESGHSYDAVSAQATDAFAEASRLRGLLKEAREALADDDLRADGPRRALLSRLDAELSPATVTR